MLFPTSIIISVSTSLPSPIGRRSPVTRFLARTISRPVFHRQSPPRSWRCRSSVGERESAESEWDGGRQSFSPSRCKHFFTRKPPWALRKASFLVFYLALAFGFLAKGPIAWTPLLTVGGIIIYARDRQVARRLKFVRGILFMLVIVALWGVPALIQTRGEFFTI